MKTYQKLLGASCLALYLVGCGGGGESPVEMVDYGSQLQINSKVDSVTLENLNLNRGNCEYSTLQVPISLERLIQEKEKSENAKQSLEKCSNETQQAITIKQQSLKEFEDKMKELDTIEKFYGWNFNTENKLKTLDENSKQYTQLQQQRTFIFDHLKKSLSSEASYYINNDTLKFFYYLQKDIKNIFAANMSGIKKDIVRKEGECLEGSQGIDKYTYLGWCSYYLGINDGDSVDLNERIKLELEILKGYADSINNQEISKIASDLIASYGKIDRFKFNPSFIRSVNEKLPTTTNFIFKEIVSSAPEKLRAITDKELQPLTENLQKYQASLSETTNKIQWIEQKVKELQDKHIPMQQELKFGNSVVISYRCSKLLEAELQTNKGTYKFNFEKK
ncbi:hypothetical protein RGC55_06550 [Helicobacter pylori]|uniref:hypothetical protein n=1 Tax=Helicobacter pylori TaxID=210 RepID=UPI00292A0964|nr:hypothetical protein [Helicobacter pylori]MDU9720580.1 hypothetical protein [Helicobacter pylori]